MQTAVIFDLDGTVVDTQKIHSRIESGMLAEYGIKASPQEITRRFSGISLKVQFDTLCGEAGVPQIYSQEVSDRKAALFACCHDEIKGIDGTIEVIKRLHGRVPLAIASASRLEIIHLALKKVGITDLFDVITSTREVKNGKPAPDVFLLTAERLGVPPKNCKVVGDGVSDMLAARAANMPCVALVEDLTRDYPAVVAVMDLREIPIEWFCR